MLFVRHSISTGEPGDAGLSPEGVDLVRRATSRLRDRDIRQIVTGPLRRNWGDRAGETREAFVERWKQCDRERDHVPKCGRSARQAGEELAAFVREIASTSRGDHVVLAVAHGGVIVDFLLNTHSEGELAAINPHYRDMKNCAVTEIRATTDSYVLDRLALPLA